MRKKQSVRFIVFSNLNRIPKAVRIFFRESTWKQEEIGTLRKRWMVTKFLELASKLKIPFSIFASIDDSLGKKGKATKALEAVDYQHNHTESTRKSKPTPMAIFS